MCKPQDQLARARWLDASARPALCGPTCALRVRQHSSRPLHEITLSCLQQSWNMHMYTYIRLFTHIGAIASQQQAAARVHVLSCAALAWWLLRCYTLTCIHNCIFHCFNSTIELLLEPVDTLFNHRLIYMFFGLFVCNFVCN